MQACDKCMDKDAAPPLLAFERWLARAQLAVDNNTAADTDPPLVHEALLPSPSVLDRGLVKDLTRHQFSKDEAVKTAQTLADKAAAAAAQITAHRQLGEPEPAVCVTDGGNSRNLLIFALGEPKSKPYLELNKQHYTKLRDMYCRALGESVTFEKEAFHAAVWCVLARYAALQVQPRPLLRVGSARTRGGARKASAAFYMHNVIISRL
jgi:hypothetical protein